MNRLIAITFPLLLLFLFAFLEPSCANANKVEGSRKTRFSRIISLYTAHTENLVSLGAESQLIGISRSDTFPEHILDKPRFSYREDPERFIAARPDLILIRPMIERSYPQLIKKLRQAGITVISLQPNSVDEIYGYWRQLGKLTGREQKAEEMISSFENGLKGVTKRLELIPPEGRPQVYFESMHAKVKTFAQKSIAIFVLQQAGGKNIASDAMQVRTTNIAAYSKERILAHAGEIDVYLAQQGRMNSITREDILNEPGFQVIKAVRTGKVYLVDEEMVSRPTLRILDGVKRLHAIFYSETLAVQSAGDNHGNQ